MDDFDPNNITTTKKSISNNVKDYSELDSKNDSYIISSNTKNASKIKSSPTEHIGLSDFKCLAKLGKGSFSEVYLVQKINSTEKYAMKIYKKRSNNDQNILNYTFSEKNVFNHPFIIKIKYVFQTSTKLFLVLEYCPNGDLSKHLAFEKKFEEQRAKFYICEILLALEYLHKHDNISLDLKPDNVVLDKEGHCKLTDFGLSKKGLKENNFIQGFGGSSANLAPEKLDKQSHDKAIDWYLLGVLFYKILIGETPYFI